MKKSIYLTSLLVQIIISGNFVHGQPRIRDQINIPDIPGYKTLKCDFHTHTVFSDGNVWPTIRAEEAWRNGLDAIAITDHIEYTPHEADIPKAHNRSYEIAEPRAEILDITLIRGSEITLPMPPGHFNAIFLQDVAQLDKENWRDAFKAATDQDAFIFWNHPGWKGQQTDGTARWYDEHTELLEKGWLHGIEIVYYREYYPEAHQWCLDKKLTMLSNSDIHDPIHYGYDYLGEEARPLTLVFTGENSLSAIKEALFDRRTAVFWDNTLIGEERFLLPIYQNSVTILNPEILWPGKNIAYIQILNLSDISYHLKLLNPVDRLSVPEHITLYAGKTVLFTIKGKMDKIDESFTLRIPYEITNLKIKPDKGLTVNVNVTLIPVGE